MLPLYFSWYVVYFPFFPRFPFLYIYLQFSLWYHFSAKWNNNLSFSSLTFLFLKIEWSLLSSLLLDHKWNSRDICSLLTKSYISLTFIWTLTVISFFKLYSSSFLLLQDKFISSDSRSNVSEENNIRMFSFSS